MDSDANSRAHDTSQRPHVALGPEVLVPHLRRHGRWRPADEAARGIGHGEHLRHAQVDDHGVRLLPLVLKTGLVDDRSASSYDIYNY